MKDVGIRQASVITLTKIPSIYVITVIKRNGKDVSRRSTQFQTTTPAFGCVATLHVMPVNKWTTNHRPTVHACPPGVVIQVV